MPRPSHSTAARSGYVFDPDLPAISSSRARTEQRHTAANTLPPPIAVCRGPSASWLAQFRRTHGYGCHECDGDSGFSPYDRDIRRHTNHGFVKPESELPPHHQHSEVDRLAPSQRGRPYHRPSPYDATDRELKFDRRGRFGHYSPPQYDSASDESCFDDDVHGCYRGYKSPPESQSLASLFGVRFRAPDPDSRSQDRENRDTKLDRSGRSRSLGRGSIETPLGSYPEYADFEDHERGGMGPPLIKYPEYFVGRGSSHPDHADFERRKDYDPKRAGVKAAGRHLSRHRFENDSAADELEDNISEAFIHRPRLARPRGHHSDSDIESVDTDTEEEYFKHIRDFDSIDDAIADRYIGRLRAPTAAEKTHRQYLVSLSKDFDRVYARAEEARAELWLLKQHDTHVARSCTENDSILEQIARQKRNLYSSRLHSATAGLDIGNRKPSPRGRRDALESDSESITPQPQDTHPQIRHHVAAHPTTTNHNPYPHKTHKNPSRPRRAPDRPTRPQKPHSKTNTALPKDQAPPSYDSITPAQVAASVQPDAANDTPRSPLATAATEAITPNTAKASPRSHGENLLLKNQMRGTLLESVQGQPKSQISVVEYSSPPAVRSPLVHNVHASPAELGSNNHSDCSGSGVATPTSSDDSDYYLDDENDDDRFERLVLNS